MIEGILCQTRKSHRSIVDLCEERFIAERCKIHQSERFSKKNEVFGGGSTHGRAPPAVLATECRNLPISSTNLKLLT